MMKRVPAGATRRVRSSLVALTLALLAFGCTEHGADTLLTPEPPSPSAELRLLVCEATTRLPTLTCAPPTAGTPTLVRASMSPGNVTLGSQGVTVQLAASGTSYNSGTQVWQTNVTVKNLIGQAIGTTDGSTTDADGVRVFFTGQPQALTGTGSIGIANATGTATFTASNQPFYQYSQVLAPNATSSAQTWQFNVPSTVLTFRFYVAVYAAVQHGGDGWVDISPALDTLDIGNASDLTTTLTGTPRDILGASVGGTVTWSSNAAGVATVNSSGVVSAQGTGTATITGTSGTRSGTATIVVIQTPSLANSTVTASPTSITANGTSTSAITVTLRDGRNNALTASGGTVVISTNAGSISATTDNGNGTYSATLTSSTTAGTATVSATLGGNALTDTETVTFAAGAVHHFAVEKSGGGSIGLQETGTAFAIRITAQDANNNTVTSFTGTAVITSTGTLSSGSGTTAAFTAGVLASHSVTISNTGTFTVTATRSGGSETGTSNSFIVDARPTVSSTSPTSGATGISESSTVTVTFSESVSFSGSSFTLECPSGTAKTFTLSASPASSATLTPSANLPNNTTCTVTVVAANVADSDANDGSGGVANNMAANYSFTFTTRAAISAVNDAFGQTVTGNVRVNTASTSPAYSVTGNDVVDATTSISFVGWNSVSGSTAKGGSISMTTTAGSADLGKFTYNPPAGFEGTDSVSYTISRNGVTSSATLTIPVSGMIWFIQTGATSCTSRASGCGRLTNPYSTLAAFTAENNGTGNNPAANDNIFLYAGSYTGAFTLLSGQKLIGAGASASLATITGISPITGSDALPSTGGSAPVLGSTLTLGSGNTLRGFNVTTSAATGISGSSFGTLTLGSDVSVTVTNATAVTLTTGTVSGAFKAITGTGGTNGIVLNGVSGTFQVAGSGTYASGGTLQSYTGDAISLTSTGAVSLDRMRIYNNGGNGVRGTTVAGFTLSNSTVDANGNAADESGLYFTNLTGTATISGDSIKNSYARNIHVANTTGTLNLTVSSGYIANTNSTAGGDGILITAASATVNPTISSNTITGSRGYHYYFNASGSGGGYTQFLSNTVTRGSITPLYQGVWITASAGATGAVTYDIYNNNMTGAKTTAVMAANNGNGSIIGKVRNNIIGNSTAGSCATDGQGVAMAQDAGSGTNTGLITGNTIQHCYYNGLWFDINSTATPTMNVTARSNTVTNIDGDYPMDVEMVGNGSGTIVCLDIGGSGLANSLGTDNSGFGLGSYFITVYSPVSLRVAGLSAYGDIDSWMTGRNTLADGYGSSDLTISPSNVASCPVPGF